MKQHKKWVVGLVLIVAGLLAIIGAVNFIVDPCQFYRKSILSSELFRRQRYFNPGLARNYDYDTVIIGSSITGNILPLYVNSRLHLKTLKLTVNDATIKEQNLMANCAIQTGKVKNVIWAIDCLSLYNDVNMVQDYFGPFPYYLYDTNPLNDYKYLLNTNTIMFTRKFLGHYLGFHKIVPQDIDLLQNYDSSIFGKAQVMKSWRKACQKRGVAAPNSNPDNNTKDNSNPDNNARDNFNKNILELINAHPDIKFYMYYPPYPILYFRYNYDTTPTIIDSTISLKKYIFDNLKDCKNVTLYDFQDDRAITFNLDNYMDIIHYSQKVNEYIIDSISKNEKRVTADNINQRLEDFKKQVSTLDVEDVLK